MADKSEFSQCTTLNVSFQEFQRAFSCLWKFARYRWEASFRRFGDRSRGINKEDPIGSSREKKLVRGLAGDGDGETYLTNGEVH